MKPRLTGWFPASVNPVRPGVYELRGLAFPFHYWDGEQWLHMADDSPARFTKTRIKKAGPMAVYVEYIKRAEWRGLTDRPTAQGGGRSQRKYLGFSSESALRMHGFRVLSLHRQRTYGETK